MNADLLRSFTLNYYVDDAEAGSVHTGKLAFEKKSVRCDC